MQSHPSYPRLADLINKYPRSAGALFQTFNDVTLSQKWVDVDVLELPECGRVAIKGLRPSLTGDEPPSPCVVVPCGLAESLSTSWIRDVFAELDEQQTAPESFFIAFCSEDSSIVYYKITKGIMKPQV